MIRVSGKNIFIMNVIFSFVFFWVCVVFDLLLKVLSHLGCIPVEMCLSMFRISLRTCEEKWKALMKKFIAFEQPSEEEIRMVIGYMKLRLRLLGKSMDCLQESGNPLDNPLTLSNASLLALCARTDIVFGHEWGLVSVSEMRIYFSTFCKGFC